jgi:soluble lytic murein transglycosylase
MGVLLLGALACNFPGFEPELVAETLLSTPVPENTPTATNTPLPTATPTPLPAMRVELGDQAIFYGDWENALAEYRKALEADSGEEIKLAARLGLARTHFLAGELLEAKDTLEKLIAEAGGSSALPEAYFLLAQIHKVEGNYQPAAEAYAQYLELRPGVIDDYVHEQRGDALSSAEDYSGAIAAYQAALGSLRQDSGLDIEIKMARAYEQAGDLATAIVAYQDIYSRTGNEYTLAYLDYILGQAYMEAGDPDSGYSAYMDAIQNFPRAYESYLALVEVVEADLPVDELQRGLIDYYAGQYGVAITAFERYLQHEDADVPTALFYLGLSQRALGDIEGALATWDVIISSYPDSHLWAEAWENTADSLWFQLGEYQAATDTLLEFVEQAPAHPMAAEFLFQAACGTQRTTRPCGQDMGAGCFRISGR